MAGCLTLSFYERKAKNKLFGLVHQEEKVVWEQWVLRVVVNNTPRPMGGDEASVIERQRIQVRIFLGMEFAFDETISICDVDTTIVLVREEHIQRQSTIFCQLSDTLLKKAVELNFTNLFV
jgi:hypothetical protein